MSGLKMVGRECSPSESIETSDTEPGSPAMEFRQRRNGSDASFKVMIKNAFFMRNILIIIIN